MPVIPEVGVGYIFAVRSLAEQINNINSESATTSLLSWAYGSLFQVNTATRDSNSAIITANITWPDGVSGVFTTDVASIAFPGAIDSWYATYLGPSLKIVTQPTVTRDVSGAVIIQPAIVIS